MTISGSGLTRSVHCGGTDHTVAPSPCSKRRSPYRLYRLPTQGSCRPNNGWNGCVTRTNCRAVSEESAFSVGYKRLEKGRFLWPSLADGVVGISASQLAYMLDGIDWRNPLHTFRPERAG